MTSSNESEEQGKKENYQRQLDKLELNIEELKKENLIDCKIVKKKITNWKEKRLLNL